MATTEATIVLNEKAPKHAAPLEGAQWKALVKEVRARSTVHDAIYQIIEDDVEYKEHELLSAIHEDRKKRKAACPKST